MIISDGRTGETMVGKDIVYVMYTVMSSRNMFPVKKIPHAADGLESRIQRN